MLCIGPYIVPMRIFKEEEEESMRDEGLKAVKSVELGCKSRCHPRGLFVDRRRRFWFCWRWERGDVVGGGDLLVMVRRLHV